MELPSELLARVLARVDDYVYVWEYRPDGTSAPLVENIGSFAFLGDVEDERREEDVWRERVHPDDRAAYDAVTDAQARGEGGAAEYRLVRPDGTQLDVFDRWRGHVREDGVCIAEGIISDVTKLKAAEAALREREEQFRLLATSAPVGIYLADLRRRADVRQRALARDVRARGRRRARQCLGRRPCTPRTGRRPPRPGRTASAQGQRLRVRVPALCPAASRAGSRRAPARCATPRVASRATSARTRT